MKDRYGFTKNERFDGEPAWSEDTGEEQQHEHPVHQPEPEPEAEVDHSTDPRYIRVETPEFVAGSTLGPATAAFNIATGRVLVTYRLRTPEEEGLDHVKGEPHYPVPLLETKRREPEQLERGERSDWKPGVSPQLLERYLTKDESTPREDAMSFGRWQNTFGR